MSEALLSALERHFREEARSPCARIVGLECERFALWPDDGPVRYHDAARPIDAARLLGQLRQDHCWEPMESDGKLLGFSTPDGKVSLEPGSQLEFSAHPSKTIGEQLALLQGFEELIATHTKPLGLTWPAVAVQPFAREPDLDVIPLPRYRWMTEALGKRDTMGLRMMRLTTSLQINLDYADEAEAIAMLRAALLLAPLSYALFANSPFYGGKPAKELSHRGAIWLHTDPDRSGLLPEAFAPGFGFRQYSEIAASRPMLYAQDAQLAFVPGLGRSMTKMLADGVVPNSAENQLHAVRQMFFEARLKPGYVEVRSIDGLPSALRAAAAAFWVGALYSSDVRKETEAAFRDLDAAGRDALFQESIVRGLDARVGSVTLQAIAQRLFPAVQNELRRRGRDEAKYLEALAPIIESGRNRAQALLDAYQADGNSFGKKTRALFAEGD